MKPFSVGFPGWCDANFTPLLIVEIGEMGELSQ